MIEQLLPPTVCCAEAFDDEDADWDDLFGEERAVVANAVPKRRREFATVRRCAREALAQLDAPAGPLLPGERGAPQWPAGVIGSMTHCDGYRAAVVARACEVTGIGIDAEPNVPLPDGILDAIALPADRAALAALPTGGPAWERMLFSAKESLYKAWFPLTRRFLGFDEAAVEIHEGGSFTARLLAPTRSLAGRPLHTFTGRWLAHDGLMLTSVTVLAESRSAAIPLS
ncbi:MAG: 4'-phosphopantetheinyl transferase family protein [Phycicoccus sp.]